MAKPYTYYIGQNSTDSHQTSPGCVLTFLRWSNRDTYNYSTPALDVREPLVVYNDCISLQISNTKSQLNSQMTAILLGGDLNYSTAVAPGDYVFANMLNWETEAETIAIRASNKQQINRFDDGFKGVFRVQTVRKRLTTAPDGKKQLVYHVHALGFNEFNNKIYFNQAIEDAFKKEGTEVAQFLVGDFFQNKLKATTEIQDLLANLFTILIGKDQGRKNKNISDYGKTHYQLPQDFGKFMGRNMTYASDMFNYILGVWDSVIKPNTTNPAQGFNFNLTKGDPGFYYTKNKIQGNKLIAYDNWNQAESWSILRGYLNDVLNEMYTTYRISPEGDVMPTVVVRQKPFTSLHFKNKIPVSKFLEMPRWKISPNLVYDLDLGRDEAARINFVQVFTRAVAETADMNSAAQISMKNFVYDKNDIVRSGLKPYVATSNFDFPESANKALRAPIWANVVSDWLIDGHLKENGTIVCTGLTQPISVGDNLEFNGIIYHIESINHTMTISPEGSKKFTTVLTLSYGVSDQSTAVKPVYAQMEHTDALTERLADYKNISDGRILPGFSDAQNIVGRVNAEETVETKEKSFTLNPNNKIQQPSQGINADGSEKGAKVSTPLKQGK